MSQASNSITHNNGVKLLESLSRRMETLSFPSPNRCIYRVPERFREVNPNAYTPKVVSIGPLHHGAPNLQAMEKHKLGYLYHFIRRNRVGLDYLVESVKEKEQILRDSYAEIIELSSHKFLEIILVDSVFILEFLLRGCCPTYSYADSGDLIFNNPNSFLDIGWDLFLQENQLPFFILVDLLAKIPRYKNDAHFQFIELASSFINESMAQELVDNEVKLSSDTVRHLLHMLLLCYQPSVVQTDCGATIESIPGVFELHQAGIELKVSSSANITNVQFKDGVLEIPRLTVWDSTERLFRNLIAFEQCHFIRDLHFLHYVSLMESLVNSPQDAELLIQKDIIHKRRGTPTEVSDILVNLGIGIALRGFYYNELCEELNAYRGKRWNRWKAILKQNYFNTPWASISVGAAILLLVLTFLQTIFSGMSIS